MAGVLGAVLLYSFYWSYEKFFGADGVVRYATAEASRGTLILSISGSGQVSAFNQVDLKSKAAGEIMGVYAAVGQEVLQGALLVSIDQRDAERAVRDAETALETARLELDKMLAPVDELEILQAQNSLIQAEESRQTAEENLKKSYEDGFNNVASAFLDLPDIMAGIHDMLFGNALAGASQLNLDYYADSVKNYDASALIYKEDARNSYQKARLAYDKNFTDYKASSRFSDEVTVESLISETYDTTKDIAEAIKNTNNLVQFYKDKLIERNVKPSATADLHLTALATYTSEINSTLASILSSGRNIQDYKDSIVSAGRTIGERALSYENIKNGPDELDIRAKRIAVQQKEDALESARQALADTGVRAPFTGVIAKVNAKKGDMASLSTAVATLITK